MLRALFLPVALLAAAPCPAQTVPVLTAPNAPNSVSARSKPYVVLVSLDGFRYDYAARYHATHLTAIAARGASAPNGMIPVYPSLTFPNHYAIVTGLYPEHDGIVANSFYDPARHQSYSLGDSTTVTDGSWYAGTPLWVLAEQQGMRAADFFWPGSEAAIQGVRPSYYLKYDKKVPNPARVRQVIDWLRLPPDQRPHFITLYMSDADDAGHAYGPDSPQLAEAVHALDQNIGTLDSALTALHLPIDLVVVADHGMVTVEGDWISLDQFEPDIASHVDKTNGPLMYARSDSDAAHIVAALAHASDKFTVVRRAELPAWLHDDANARSGDPMVVTNGPYLVRVVTPTQSRPHEVGAHGFDPAKIPEMKASFFAAGPQIKHGVTVPSFQNIDVYPLIAHILGLKTGPIDGDIGPLWPILVAR